MILRIKIFTSNLREFQGDSLQTTFTVPTDKREKIKLESQLIYAIWKKGIGRGGANIELEVRTAFVGEGAKISITVMGSKSKKLGTFDDLIFGNRYHCAIPLPPDLQIGEVLWFDVKISKLKLKGKSNRIPAYPMPELLSMTWDRNAARRGDIVKLIADFDRVHDNCNVTVFIYEYDRNGIHDSITQIPTTLKGTSLELLWEYQYHEDVNEIPTQTELNKYGATYNPPEYFFVVDIDGSKFGIEQESGILEFKDTIRIVVEDSGKNPLPNFPVTLFLPDGNQIEAVTDSSGIIMLEDQPPGKYKYTFAEEV